MKKNISNKINPLVSIIVPIFNVEEYIGLCIESLIKQSYSNIEIILVDDGSPDMCPEICELYRSKDKRIKVIHKENGGLVSARQAGLEVSIGELICNIDGDDWVDSDFVESLVDEQMKYDSDAVVAGQVRHLFESQVELLNCIPCGLYKGASLIKFKETMMSHGDFYSTGVYTYLWNKLFKRNVIYQHQMNVDQRISQGEDAACVYPALASCNRVCIIDNCSYHYRQRSNSMLKSKNDFKKEVSNIRLLYSQLCEFLPKTYRSQIEDYILLIFTVRSGGLPINRDIKYPYNKEFENKKLVVCSAGTLGQQLYGKLMTEKCSVVSWIDDDYWSYRRYGLNVDPINSVTDLEYDYIVIATLDYNSVNEFKRTLIDVGVNENQILIVNKNLEDRKKALDYYLYQY